MTTPAADNRYTEDMDRLADVLTAVRGDGETLAGSRHAGWLLAADLDPAHGRSVGVVMYAPGNGTQHRAVITDLDRVQFGGAYIADLGGRYVVAFPRLPWRTLTLSGTSHVDVDYVTEHTGAPLPDAIHLTAMLATFLHVAAGGTLPA